MTLPRIPPLPGAAIILLLCAGGCGPPDEVVEPAESTWIKLAPGVVNAGSPATEPCRWGNERQHTVTLAHRFVILSTEVTRAHYRREMGKLPEAPGPISCTDDTCPVSYATWHDAAAYCNALSVREGVPSCYKCVTSAAGRSCDALVAYTGSAIAKCRGFRLPTEAEWEYAYRAGSSSAYYNGTNSSCTDADPGLDQIAWYDGNSFGMVQPVGLKHPNAWGLYDMAGNLWEWTNDTYRVNPGDPASVPTDPTLRVFRGGSAANYARKARAASRDAEIHLYNEEHIGFRCVRTVDVKAP